MKHYGLLGKSLGHSFSKTYFTAQFERNGTVATYENYETDSIEPLVPVLRKLDGFNVTIPYKQAIIPFLDVLHPDAAEINAVNTVQVIDGKLHGYNTDHLAIQACLSPRVSREYRALVFGSGGASRAVVFALKNMALEYTLVSRKAGLLNYHDLRDADLLAHRLLINCTPLGMYPHIELAVDIPYQVVGKSHIAFDLIYNPKETLFLKNCREAGAQTMNGERMLEIQANESWKIWTC